MLPLPVIRKTPLGGLRRDPRRESQSARAAIGRIKPWEVPDKCCFISVPPPDAEGAGSYAAHRFGSQSVGD